MENLSEPDSSVVEEHKKSLIGRLMLHTLIDDQLSLANFLSIAKHASVGTDFEDLIYQLCIKAREIQDQSLIVFGSFNSNSRDIIQQIGYTYGFLLQGETDAALITMKTIGTIAAYLKDQSTRLKERYESFQNETQQLNESIAKVREENKQHSKETESQRQSKEISKKIQEGLLEMAKKEEEEFQLKIQESQKREDNARLDERSFLWAFATILTAPAKLGAKIVLKSFGDDIEKTAEEVINRLDDLEKAHQTHAQEIANQAHQDLLAYESKAEDARQRKREAYQKMTQATLEIEQLTNDKDVSSSILSALRQISESASCLIQIMEDCIAFWSQFDIYYKKIDSPSIVEIINKRIETFTKTANPSLSEEELKSKRKEFWSSNPFFSQLQDFIGLWVALEDVTGEYITMAGEKYPEAYQFMKDSITTSEASKIIPEIAKQCRDRIEKRTDEVNVATNEANKLLSPN